MLREQAIASQLNERSNKVAITAIDAACVQAKGLSQGLRSVLRPVTMYSNEALADTRTFCLHLKQQDRTLNSMVLRSVSTSLKIDTFRDILSTLDSLQQQPLPKKSVNRTCVFAVRAQGKK